jgi:hypothetical protein
MNLNTYDTWSFKPKTSVLSLKTSLWLGFHWSFIHIDLNTWLCYIRIKDWPELVYSVLLRPKVHRVSPVTSIFHWPRCSEVVWSHYWLGNCSFCQITAEIAPMQAYACLESIWAVKGDPHMHGVQEGTQIYSRKGELSLLCCFWVLWSNCLLNARQG